MARVVINDSLPGVLGPYRLEKVNRRRRRGRRRRGSACKDAQGPASAGEGSWKRRATTATGKEGSKEALPTESAGSSVVLLICSARFEM